VYTLDQGRLFEDIEPKPKKRKLRRRAKRRPRPPKDLKSPAPLPFIFDGLEYAAPFDEERLTGQMLKNAIFSADGTMNDKRARGERLHGLFEYQVIVNWGEE
jgi:hypothetical protein